MRKQENKASLLELVFEGRNKSYGAYVLRRDYDQRMGTALGIMLSGILALCLWYQFRGTQPTDQASAQADREWMKFTQVEAQPPKPVIPEPVAASAKTPAPKVATQKFTSTIDIKPTVKDPMPANEVLQTAAVSTVTQAGKDPGAIARPVITTGQTGGGTAGDNGDLSAFQADERQPAFPGGEMALRNFLATHLNTPSSLDEGERRTVRIRFTVLADGRVDQFTIEASGGEEFDREVIRVCKRMPRWVPGSQNGQHVSVQYVLPVTFLSTGS
ncbi:MAG: energy transducer TonB [Bacteroidota bacterium]